MKIRTKDCYVCNDSKNVICWRRVDELKDWMFLCGECLKNGKADLFSRYAFPVVGLVCLEHTADYILQRFIIHIRTKRLDAPIHRRWIRVQ